MRGRIPVHKGNGPGLSSRRLGSKGGSESVTLITNQLTSHTHSLNADSAGATQTDPQGRVLAKTEKKSKIYEQATADTSMAPAAIDNTGGGQRHSNLMPTLCVHFIVALVGVYPSRS
jgi:microcystin-dependent protein